MSESQREAEFVQRARVLLESDEQRLDGATLSRLKQSRALAIEQGTARMPSRLRVWAPLASAAVAAAAVALLWGGPGINGTMPVEAGEDIEILLAEESLDLLEDLEFYEWLEGQPEIG